MLSFLLSVYLFAAASSGLTAVMNVSFWLAVLVFFYQCWRGEIKIAASISPAHYAFLAFFVAVLLSLVANPAWFSNNFAELWKDHARNFIVFLLVTGSIRSMERLRPLLYAAIAGFTVRSLLLLGYYWADMQIFFPYRKGFALDATFVTVATASLLFFDRTASLRAKVLLSVALLIQTLPLFLHGSRTPILAILMGVGVSALLGRYWKAIAIMLATAAVALIGITSLRPELLNRYESTFQGHTYQQDGSVLERQGIWRLTGPLVAHQPLLGYGPGWRKLALLAGTDEYLQPMAKSEDKIMKYAYAYFNGGKYGKVNPHSLYYQLAFETGLGGLIVYLIFIGSVLMCAWRLLRARLRTEDTALALTGVALVVTYLITGFANGLLAGSALLLVVAAVLANRYGEARRTEVRA